MSLRQYIASMIIEIEALTYRALLETFSTLRPIVTDAPHADLRFDLGNLSTQTPYITTLNSLFVSQILNYLPLKRHLRIVKQDSSLSLDLLYLGHHDARSHNFQPFPSTATRGIIGRSYISRTSPETIQHASKAIRSGWRGAG